MALVLVVLALAALVAVAQGGRPERLAGLRLRRARLVGSATGAYLLGALLARWWPPAHVVLLTAAAGFAGLFVWLNRRVPGLLLIGLGLVANALVVVLNGAMPVSVRAAEQAGMAPAELDLPGDRRHEPLGETTLLPWLADTVPFALPVAPQVVSAGDVLVAAGAGLALYTGMTRHRTPAQPRVRASTRARDSTTSGSYS